MDPSVSCLYGFVRLTVQQSQLHKSSKRSLRKFCSCGILGLIRMIDSPTHGLSFGCFGCCSKLAPIIAVDEPSKGLGIQGQVVKKPSMSDDFWSTTTSACDLDHSAIQSQRSVSSISVSNQNIGGGGTVGVSSNADFANHGLLLWNQSRLQWTGNKMPGNRAHQRWDHRLSWNAPYENLLGMTNGFARPIPLSEMVEFLVDVWEQEGLYD